MADAILTLQYPKGLKGIPIATTSNIIALRSFKRTVLQEWEKRIEETGDEGERMLYRLELQRLKTALNIFISDEDTNNADQV
jgi:hypothetical protein